MASVRNLLSPVENWKPYAIPVAPLIHLEERKGKQKPVIKKALVDLEKAPFKTFAAMREKWCYQDDYLPPGPTQYFGPDPIVQKRTHTLVLENE